MLGFSVGPTRSTRWDRCARARAKPDLGETDFMNSVRPILAMIKQGVGQANSRCLIAHKIIATDNREFARPSR